MDFSEISGNFPILFSLLSVKERDEGKCDKKRLAVHPKGREKGGRNANAPEITIAVLMNVLQVTPMGTNVNVMRLMWAMLNGSFLKSREQSIAH
ncbi:hypothetical protein KFU94_46085 [Chloroflexi bacterium TSY]|nr:hypothetical protein [Chloroflexi bacterium TSY]